ncbi:HAD family hydrolase [Lysinibacillus fusiformis]|uniref:HAD family hydrolase n=1 Tax=Lysinibacillus fusiformis TaxID=28031 RepID=UPI0036585CFC
MGIKAVLFDLDGTLLNRDESVNFFIESQYERLGMTLDDIPKESYVSRFIQLDKRGYVWKDKVYQQLVQEFNIVSLTWEELLQDYINEFKNYCVAFPNVISLLEQLKTDKYLLGIITNGYGYFQMDNIKALAIEKYFDVILVSEWENMKKPNPQLFLRALDKLQVSPHDSIFLGDHPETDVKGAQAVGMKGIWKKDAHWDHVEADAILDDLSELPSIIDYLNNKQ